MRLVRRIAGGFVLLIVVVLAAAYVDLLRSLPETRGTFEVAGISDAIEIVRDADGIPHIFASTKPDALYGLGWVHAQDRLWQMEFQRRVGRGRLSEVLGSATIKQDRFLRTVGFGRAAEAAWARLPPDARNQIDAYVRGVNAFIASHHGSRLPPEFSILGFEPEPWTGPDVIAWVKMMAWDLSANYALELMRHDIAAKVGVDRMRELLPPYPARGLNILSRIPPSSPSSIPTNAAKPQPSTVGLTPPGVSYSGALVSSLPATEPILRNFLLGGGGATDGIGSNNWVVDGTLTASGKPLLANDPHLGAQAPSLWYLAHITAGDFDVIGATLPGTPAVAIGRNRFVAWGATNMFADVEDLYRERLDSTGRSAEFKGEMEPLWFVDEVIKVKGQPDIHVEVRISRHGPLVSDAINANNGVAEGSPTAVEPLAFRWTALDDEDNTIDAFLKLNDARNWSDFTDAMREFVAPSQNFVYADVDGHIGYYAPGHVPIRASGDGLLPADGWTGDAEWTGWIPFDALPHTYDPPSHFIVTANNRPVPPDYKYAISADYHEPFRAQRITDLLSQRTRLTPDDFRAIQSDTYSLHARALQPLLLAHVHPEGEFDKKAVEILRQWNFDARGDSAAAAIFEAWFLRLAPLLVEDDLGPVVTRNYERRFTSVTRFVTNTLKTGSSTFCGRSDPRSQSRDTAHRSCDAIVTEALHDGVATLAHQMGANMDRWQWESVHRAVFAHQAFDGVTGLGWLLRRTIANQGDWSTVDVGAVNVERPFDQTELPGYRQIVDLSPANDSRFLGSLGQAGHFLSSHYADELERWRDVRHLPMTMDREKILGNAAGRLRLVPRPPG
jgi:penicillin amidase